MSRKPCKTPMRRCIVTREHHPKQALIRVVRSPEGSVFIDPSGKANGRGAYLKKSVDVIAKAKKTKVLDKHLETSVPENLYDELIAHLNDA